MLLDAVQAALKWLPKPRPRPAKVAKAGPRKNQEMSPKKDCNVHGKNGGIMMINQPNASFFQRILIGFVKMMNHVNFGQTCFAHPAGYSTSKTVPNIYIHNVLYIYLYI